MTLLILSFIAGVLTVLAPCILPLLPVVIGGSVALPNQKRNLIRPLVIASSLAASIFFFTLLLKASTSLLGIPVSVWQILSGSIVLLLGVNFLFPTAWEKFAVATHLHTGSNSFFARAFAHKGLGGEVLTGVALGPVFSSCSPTYALIVASVIPVSLGRGILYLLAYCVGLAGMLLTISYVGQSIVGKLGWAVNPHGWFRKCIGVLFVCTGLMVIFGFDKTIQTFVLERGWYDPISKFEQSIER